MKFERLYRHLVRLYPARFRSEFGDDIIQLARDQWREKTTFGMRVVFLFKILGDLTSSLVQQHIEKQRSNMQNMPKNKLSLRLAIAAVALSFVGCVVWQLGTVAGTILLICSSLLLAMRVVAASSRMDARAGHQHRRLPCLWSHYASLGKGGASTRRYCP